MLEATVRSSFGLDVFLGVVVASAAACAAGTTLVSISESSPSSASLKYTGKFGRMYPNPSSVSD